MIQPFIHGLGMGAALIIAIGAQNAFVLIQGIRRNHPMAVGMLCVFLDAILIAAGVLGVGTLVASSQILRIIAGVGGCLFLVSFGVKSLCQVWKAETLQLDLSGTPDSLAKTLMQTLAITLLNPHVYLDTVVMLGSISATYLGDARLYFGLGGITASTLWFLSLAQAGKMLAPLFARPRAWQVLHCLVGIMVWWIAYGLGFGVWKELHF